MGMVGGERSLIEKIHRLFAFDWEFFVQHSYHKANQCANALANYGCSIDLGSCFFDVCPRSISHLMLSHLLGNSTPIRCNLFHFGLRPSLL